MIDYRPIKDFSDAIASYPPNDIEVDIGVYNGVVSFSIEQWNKVSHKTVYSNHMVCNSHAEACMIADTLNTFIHRRV